MNIHFFTTQGAAPVEQQGSQEAESVLPSPNTLEGDIVVDNNANPQECSPRSRRLVKRVSAQSFRPILPVEHQAESVESQISPAFD